MFPDFIGDIKTLNKLKLKKNMYENDAKEE